MVRSATEVWILGPTSLAQPEWHSESLPDARLGRHADSVARNIFSIFLPFASSSMSLSR